MSKNSLSGNGGLYLVFGGLVVVVGLGVFLYSGENLGSLGNKTTTPHTTVSAPTLEKTKH